MSRKTIAALEAEIQHRIEDHTITAGNLALANQRIAKLSRCLDIAIEDRVRAEAALMGLTSAAEETIKFQLHKLAESYSSIRLYQRDVQNTLEQTAEAGQPAGPRNHE